MCSSAPATLVRVMTEQDTLGERPHEAENVLRAEYEFTDEPLDLREIDGMYNAIKEVARTKNAVYLECEDRVADYKLYWNSSTETVRVGAVAMCASYEVPEDYVSGLTEDTNE